MTLNWKPQCWVHYSENTRFC